MEMRRDLTNREIAEVFREIAAVYSLKGNDLFHVRAYENAAQSIETFTIPLREIWAEGKLDEVPGIGTSFTAYLDELFRTGSVKHFESLIKKAPAGMFPLLEVPGVGPKTAWKLAKALHLTRPAEALSRVSQAIGRGSLGKILSPKMATKIQNAILRTPGSSDRMLLWQAEQIAADVISYLKQGPEVLDAVALGSLRRRVPTVGDIDIAVSTRDPKAVVAHLQKFAHLKRQVSNGEKMLIFIHTTGRQVDIKTSPPESWGEMLVHYTGSKLHNIHLRTLALEKNKSLSEFGLEGKRGKEIHPDEAGVYKALGLPLIPPELREDSGEIEAAKKGKLPKLITLADIQGDLHVHSSLEFPSSHDSGDDSVETLLAKAAELKYRYLGISDHSPKISGFSVADRLAAVRKRNAQIRAVAEKYGETHKYSPKVLIGLEVDILADGALSLEDEALGFLDYAIVSIHANFTLPEAAQTQRILKALSHPKSKILGHPTTRHLLKRDEIQCDWRTIFAYCRDHDKYLEIDAAIDRLDLPYPLIRLAGEMGCRFVIDTDSHRASELTLMRFGVDMARKGWVTSQMVANTQTNLSLD